MVLLVPYYLLLLSFIVRGLIATWFPSQVISTLVSYRAEGQSPVVKFDCVLCGFVFLEFLIIRLWFIHLCRSKHYQSVIGLYEKIPPLDQQKSIFLINCLTAYIGVTALPKDSLFYYMQYLRSESDIESAVILVAEVLLVLYVGYYCSDMVLFYITSIRAFLLLNQGNKQLLHSARECIHGCSDQFDFLVRKVIKAINSIQQMNHLARILIAINKIIVLPLFSCFTIVAVISTETLNEQIMKSFLLSLGFFYTSRGYICTWLFSRIHSDSFKLSRNLFSIAARNTKITMDQRKYLDNFTSELICDKTHFALQEWGLNRITGEDLIFSIATTLELIILGLGFYYKNLKVA